MAIRKARASLLLMALVGALFLAQPAHAADDATGTEPGDGAIVEAIPDDATPDDALPVVRDIVFPVVGVTGYSDGFGDCRDACTRLHEGIDILTYGWKGVPVVAAHDGTVTRVGLDGEKAGCSVDLTDEEGWTSRYLHLNTDLPGTDLDADDCVAPGIEVGNWIPAGTLIGWVGDTGNAEDTVPHLHFEIRDPEGVAIDPYESLEGAREIRFRWITPSESIDLMASAFRTPQPLVYVIDPADLITLVEAASAAVRFDAPLLAYDTADPGPARFAIKGYAPERIVVLTTDSGPLPYMDDLRLIAPIVERYVIEQPVIDEPAPSETTDVAADPSTVESADVALPTGIHAPVDTRLVTLFTTTRRGTANHIEDVASVTPGDEVPIIIGGRDGARDIGTVAVDLPGADANPDGLWWLTADGWRFTEDLSEVPDPGIAYVPASQLSDETIAFLLSSARSPAMPLWNHQPTSRTTKSL